MNDKDFWIQVRRGLLLVVTAIEHRWGLPRVSMTTLAAPQTEAPPHSEPPETPARSQTGDQSGAIFRR